MKKKSDLKARPYLFKLARDMVKDKHIVVAFTRDGTIYIKQIEAAKAIRMKDEKHLEDLKTKWKIIKMT